MTITTRKTRRATDQRPAAYDLIASGRPGIVANVEGTNTRGGRGTRWTLRNADGVYVRTFGTRAAAIRFVANEIERRGEILPHLHYRETIGDELAEAQPAREAASVEVSEAIAAARAEESATPTIIDITAKTYNGPAANCGPDWNDMTVLRTSGGTRHQY